MDQKIFLGLAWMAVGLLQDILTMTTRFDMRGVAVVHLTMLVFLFMLVKQDRD